VDKMYIVICNSKGVQNNQEIHNNKKENQNNLKIKE